MYRTARIFRQPVRGVELTQRTTQRSSIRRITDTAEVESKTAPGIVQKPTTANKSSNGGQSGNGGSEKNNYAFWTMATGFSVAMGMMLYPVWDKAGLREWCQDLYYTPKDVATLVNQGYGFIAWIPAIRGSDYECAAKVYVPYDSVYDLGDHNYDRDHASYRSDRVYVVDSWHGSSSLHYGRPKVKNGKWIRNGGDPITYYLTKEAADSAAYNDHNKFADHHIRSLRDGKYTQYQRDGRVSKTMTIKNGQYDGDVYEYFMDGGLKSHERYVNGINVYSKRHVDGRYSYGVGKLSDKYYIVDEYTSDHLLAKSVQYDGDLRVEIIRVNDGWDYNYYNTAGKLCKYVKKDFTDKILSSIAYDTSNTSGSNKIIARTDYDANGNSIQIPAQSQENTFARLFRRFW